MISLTRAIKLYGNGRTYRQVASWVDLGYLRAELRPGLGRGGQERWVEIQECQVMERMCALVELGVAPRLAIIMARGDESVLAAMERAIQACRTVGRLTPG
jgi:hypothetical protein